MKIKKIEKIKALGIFNDFCWQNDCNEFGKYNFFYGWNYCGKTTLSRLFRCLEIKVQHINFPSAKFSLKTDKLIITQKDIFKDYPIRVFNEDSVEEIFQWNNEDAKIDPVLILGKEAKDLGIRSKKLREERQDKENLLVDNEKEEKRKKNEVSTFLTERASAIRNLLGITNPQEFNKNSLKEKIKNIKDSYQDCIFSDKEKEEILKGYNSEKPEKIYFDIPQLKLFTFVDEVKNILSEEVTAQQIIKKLKENSKLSDWVKNGIDLHKKEELCQFCGNPLPSGLFEKLNKHFSVGFDNLMNRIEQKKGEIDIHLEEIQNLNLPAKAQFTGNSQLEFENKLRSIKALRTSYINALELLKKELEGKREKPFDSLEIQEIPDVTEELKRFLDGLDSIVKNHNKKVSSFEESKQKAKKQLIKHFSAEFIKERRYFDVQKEINEIGEKNEILKLKISDLGTEIEQINKQIIAENIGAERINGYLKQFFNDDKLRIETTDDGKYKLYRNGQIAKNLSTGEKNIISLIYFFAKLEETNFNFNNSVIFIDDPVSSLDSNHIFKVYGFIYEKLKDCGQLFITTHNFDFFNLLKDLRKSAPESIKQMMKFYLVKKVKHQSGESTCIKNLPDVLLKHKSEYNYLFSILKSFNESGDKSGFGLYYLLPNILRRFFEGYLYMRYPNRKSFNDKAKAFLKDTNLSDKRKALKVMDEYSHEENPTHALKFPDVEEVRDVAPKFIQLFNMHLRMI